MNYQIEIDKAIDSCYFGSEDIYDYRNTPLEAIMNSFYGFCRTNLDINSNALKFWYIQLTKEFKLCIDIH
ncbi:MAG: hypothetical protein HRT67_01950 [Flavobacteriaceae bacterium]|nr:hypothetical protein [Flavobacteriaceae bacterium]